MSLIERLKKAFSNKPYLAASSRGSSGIDVAKPAFSHLLGIKSYNSWVYAAATMNAVACASTPLRLYAKSGNSVRKLWNTREPSKAQRRFLSGDSRCQPSPTAMRKVVEFGDDWVEVTDDHPLLRLFSRANPYLNGFDATVLRIIHGELTGNAYIHPVIDRALGVPTELWLMPPQWVTIVPDKELFIKGYKYGASEATQVDLKPDEVIHFKRPHPNDMYYGMGKVEGAWGSVQANNALHEMDHAMFKNRARPDYVGVVKGDPSDEELDRLEVAIKETLRGTDKVGKFILTSADLTLQPMSFPPKDLTGRDEIVEEIAAIFGVPVSMLKTNDPNLASATTGFAQWREGTIAPLLRMDEETLNQRLLPLFGIEGEAVLAYDDPVRSNEQFELTSRSASVAGGWRTPNEARTEEGLEPLDTPYANELKGSAAPAAQGQPMPSVGGGVAPAPPAVAETKCADALTPPNVASLTPAQTSSLVELASKATDGTLSLATARAIAAAAFPSLAPMTIGSIFDGVVTKSPAQVADEASKKNCGVGSEGFEAGNDCGAGDGAGNIDSETGGNDGNSVEIESVLGAEKMSVDEFLKTQEKGDVKTTWEQALDMQGVDEVFTSPQQKAVLAIYQSPEYELLTQQRDDDDNGSDPKTGSNLEKALVAYGGMDQTETRREAAKIYEQKVKDAVDAMNETRNPNDAKVLSQEKKELLAFEASNEAVDIRQEKNKKATVAMANDFAAKVASSKIGCCVQVMRGLALNDGQIKEMLASGVVTHDSVNSWSTKVNVVEAFADIYNFRQPTSKAVVLVLSDGQAGIVNRNNKTEGEIIRPPSSMRIVRAVQTADALVVTVEEDKRYK